MTERKRPIYITLAGLRARGACAERFQHLMENITYDKSCTPENVHIPIELILEVNGPADANWALWAIGGSATMLRRVADQRAWVTHSLLQFEERYNPGFTARYTRAMRKHLKGMTR